MTRGCLLFGGLTIVSAMMAADASAQDCPEWLKWVCPDSSISNPAAKEAAQSGRGKDSARTKATSAPDSKTRTTGGATGDLTTNPKSQQTAPEVARQAQAGRTAGGGDQRLPQKSKQRAGRLGGAPTNDQEKELFEQFLVWFNEQQTNAATGR
jgi:hypothetical protein